MNRVPTWTATALRISGAGIVQAGRWTKGNATMPNNVSVLGLDGLPPELLSASNGAVRLVSLTSQVWFALANSLLDTPTSPNKT
jgi:hypothetical protein